MSEDTTTATSLDPRKVVNIVVMGVLSYGLGLLWAWAAGAEWGLASRMAIGSAVPWVIGNLQKTGGLSINLPEVKAALTK